MTSREKVLNFLQENGTGYVSGQHIADELGLSRNAVWKAINVLRKRGYRIDAITNKGYRLVTDEGLLNEKVTFEGLCPYLPLDVDKRLIRVYDTVESTNSLAKAEALDGAPHGTVILANEQTHGQAHHREQFPSPKGGIYFSIILRPEALSDRDPDRLVKRIAVSICDAIAAVTEKKVTIHGINDIYLGDRKVAGTLNESVSDIENGEVQWVVSGTGIYFPSLFPDEHVTCTRNRLAADVIGEILAERYTSAESLEKVYRLWHDEINCHPQSAK